ncbi:MAG: hypothetical protein RLZ55_513, partial [Actinomycetota bacterium]
TVVSTAGSVIPAWRASPETAPLAAAASDALATATRWSAFAAAGFLVIGLLASLSLGPSRPQGPVAESQAQ